MDTELDRLLERSRKGDPDAWSALVEYLQSLVYSVSHRYGLDDDDTADVFMTTFQALYRNLDRLESGQSLPKWVAKTAARDSLRLRRLRGDTADVPLDEIVALEDRNAEREALRADDAYRVRIAMTRVSQTCRDLLSALYEDERSYQEVARQLAVPIGAIGPTRARCLEKLRRLLEEEGFFE